MDSCLLSQLKPDSPAQQWLTRFWATHEKEDCDSLLWGLLCSALSAPPLSTEHSPANLLYLSEQLSLLLSTTHELYAPRQLPLSGYFYLPPDSSTELKSILQTLVSSIKVDQIFLMATYDDAPRFDLLIILAKPPTCLSQLLSKLTNACQKYGGVTLSLHTPFDLENQLLSGSLFFQRLFTQHSPLYESKSATTWAIPPSPSLLSLSKQSFQLHQARAQDFFAAARFSFQAGLCSQTVFLLHQAAEQALHALFASLTGKRISTHNITYLLQLSRRFSPLLHEVFESDDGHQLLKTLQKAYLNARYDPDFSGSLEDATALFSKVERLLFLLPSAFDSYLNA